MPRTTRRVAVHPISLRELTVVRTHDLTPGMRRVTLGGPELGSFVSSNGFAQPEFRSDGFDDDVRLIFPYPGRDEPVLPVQEDGNLEWPRDPRPIFKAYTVRRWDPPSGELDVDFVKHGTGVATVWAYRAQPGDRVHVAGPAASQELPRADWLLVVGDDTAVPAIARLLEELPEGTRAQVFIEIARDEHRQPLTDLAGVTVTWISRYDTAPGDATLLLDAIRATEWWNGSVFAWVAGESTVVKTIRRYLVEERDVPKDRVDFTGYWRLGEVVTLEHDPAVPDPERNEEAFEKVHELGELLPPIALRAAVNLGIPELLARGVTRAPELADAIGADPTGVAKLMRYLESIEIVRPAAAGGHELTDAGDYLTEDFVIDVLHKDGYSARRELAFYGLEEAIRTGGDGYAAATGGSYASLLQEEWYERRMLELLADYARYVAEPLAALELWSGIDTVTVRSDAAGVIAQALVGALPNLRVTIAALPSRIALLREQLEASAADADARSRISFTEHSLFETTTSTGVVLIAKELGALSSADAVLALRRAAASLAPGGHVVVHEELLDAEELDEHVSEADLLEYSLHGTGVRTDAELRALFDEAGLTVEDATVFGWGARIYRLAAR